jgi:hypothetical protein
MAIRLVAVGGGPLKAELISMGQNNPHRTRGRACVRWAEGLGSEPPRSGVDGDTLRLAGKASTLFRSQSLMPVRGNRPVSTMRS